MRIPSLGDGDPAFLVAQRFGQDLLEDLLVLANVRPLPAGPIGMRVVAPPASSPISDQGLPCHGHLGALVVAAIKVLLHPFHRLRPDYLRLYSHGQEEEKEELELENFILLGL